MIRVTGVCFEVATEFKSWGTLGRRSVVLDWTGDALGKWKSNLVYCDSSWTALCGPDVQQGCIIVIFFLFSLFTGTRTDTSPVFNPVGTSRGFILGTCVDLLHGLIHGTCGDGSRDFTSRICICGSYDRIPGMCISLSRIPGTFTNISRSWFR
jgi:hypothetical protein